MQLNTGSFHGGDYVSGLVEAGTVHLGIDSQQIFLVLVARHNDIIDNIIGKIGIAGDETDVTNGLNGIVIAGISAAGDIHASHEIVISQQGFHFLVGHTIELAVGITGQSISNGGNRSGARSDQSIAQTVADCFQTFGNAEGLSVDFVNGDTEGVEDLFQSNSLTGTGIADHALAGKIGEAVDVRTFTDNNVVLLGQDRQNNAHIGVGLTVKLTGAVNGLNEDVTLLNDQVDCVVIDNAPAQEFVKANPGLMILDTEFANEDYAIGIAKDNTALLEAVNGAIAELKEEGKLQEIIDKYIPAA